MSASSVKAGRGRGQAHLAPRSFRSKDPLGVVTVWRLWRLCIAWRQSSCTACPDSSRRTLQDHRVVSHAYSWRFDDDPGWCRCGVWVAEFGFSMEQVGQVQMSDIVVVVVVVDAGGDEAKDTEEGNDDDNDGGNSESQESKSGSKKVVTLVATNVGRHWHCSQFRTSPRSLQNNGTPFHSRGWNLTFMRCYISCLGADLCHLWFPQLLFLRH